MQPPSPQVFHGTRLARAVAAERARQGDPDLALLAFGAVRPYKGTDLALDALALVDPALRVRLTVAGRFWKGGDALREQARRLGLGSDAARAVGAANGQNPLPIVLPCHRVIGANGSLTGFGGGLHVKRFLLEHEGALLPLG